MLLLILLFQISRLEILYDQAHLTNNYIQPDTAQEIKLNRLHFSSLNGDILNQIVINIESVAEPTNTIDFDVFYFDQDDYNCYYFYVLAQKNWDYPCPFLKHPQQYSLKIKHLELDLASNQYRYVLIDNSPFPPGGASFDFPIEVSQSYSLEIYISEQDYLLNIILGSSMAVGIFLVITLLVIIVLIRKKVRKFKNEPVIDWKLQKNKSIQDIPQNHIQTDENFVFYNEPRTNSPADNIQTVLLPDERRNMSDGVINESAVRVQSFASDRFRQPNYKRSKFFE